MSVNNSTVDLVNNQLKNKHSMESVVVFHEEIELEDKASTYSPSKFLQTLQNRTYLALKEYERPLKIGIRLLLHFVLIGYFSWATYYFIKFSNEDLESTTCTGYGLLMISFVIIYFRILYYLLMKPFLFPLLYKPYTKHSNRLHRVTSKKVVGVIFYLIIFLTFGIYLIFDTSDDRIRLMPLAGLFTFLLLGWLFCKYPEHIKWRPILCGLILQFLFGLLTIRWDVGRNIFKCIGNKTTTFLSYATDGAAFVYGDLLVYKEAVFAFQALSTIYFLGFVINLLYHYGIMQKIIVTLGELLQTILGTTICESVNSAANIFLGMSEAPLLLKPYLEDLTASEIHSIMTSGFATVSGTVLAAYISFGASASHLITSSVMSAPAALCYSKLLLPEVEKTKATRETIQLLKSEHTSALDAASKGASVALEMVLGVCANLIAFISMVYFINGVLAWIGGLVGYDGDSTWSIEIIVGYIFMPVSFLMGVPWDECNLVGKLIGIKTVINEFAAFKELGKMDLRPRTKVIATYAICGFSNPGSIGIMISALSVLMPKKRDVITSLVFRAFIGGEIVCFLTACIAALVIPDKLLL